MRWEMIQALEEGATLVTVNRRLARHLHTRFITAQLSRGRQAWETPQIFSWSDFLTRCWEQHQLAEHGSAVSARVLLNSFQEQALWERIVGASAEANLLLQVPSTAAAAREAWALLHGWQIGTPFPDALMNEDVRAFSQWAAECASQCDLKGWVDAARLPDAFIGCLAERTRAVPKRLLLAGFDEFTPQQQGLLDAHSARGTPVIAVESARRAGRLVRMGSSDVTAEIQAVARWVRDLLERGEVNRVGVVVPNLADLRLRIEAIFDDILLPGAILPEQALLDRPYNISLGIPLSRYPIIHTALLVFELARGALSLEKLGALLRSPYLAGAEVEMARRALLDARLRELGVLTVPLEVLCRYASAVKETGGRASFACPLLAERLNRSRDERITSARLQAPSTWSGFFVRWLLSLGWPGQRPLNSHEYQAVSAWYELLEGLGTLDAVLPSLDLGEACAHVRRLALGRVFQPQSADAPVQVLGTLEATGMEFDHLWVMGLTDDAFPVSARPNPFIPMDLQRRHGLPHATPERELHYAERLLSRLMKSAPEVILSYPESDGERAVRASALIAGVAEADKPRQAVAVAADYCTRIHASRALESLEDFSGPGVPFGEQVSGGANLFKDQSACPFRAFAIHRLGARRLASGQAGLDPRMRGKLLHRALQCVWVELKNHRRLQEISSETLEQLVARAAAHAVAAVQTECPHIITDRFAALEEARIARLLREWLSIEHARSPFDVIETELNHVVSIGGIEVKTRIDRIDRVPDGRSIVIDYKTGKVDANAWLGERPDDPQLPLYAIEGGVNVAAVLFARVSVGDMRFLGIAREGDIVPGVRAFEETRISQAYGSWEGLFDTWRQVLTRLGEDYRAGAAQVDPKAYPETCRLCELGTLCRVGELHEFGGEEATEADING
ncbi:MAG: PD-(D/E)XK nuclease family protein [Gammaproteobacteria bacterium]|nr:PD-(D/E)XK nuclease family protein [Gammaproteobacteria bacterium]